MSWGWVLRTCKGVVHEEYCINWLFDNQIEYIILAKQKIE